MEDRKENEEVPCMRRLCDIHCHILPGVDDGASSMEESIALLQSEYDQGVRAIILTPHFRRGMFEAPRSLVRDRFDMLRDEAALQLPGDLELSLGCEFHVDQEMDETLEQDPAYRMLGGSFVLTEFSGYHTESDIRRVTNSLVIEGWVPIIAHIERYPACRKPALVEELRRMGAYIQVNADALLGRDGLSARLYTRKLVGEGLGDYIGSDAHNMKERAPHLAECAEFLDKKYGPGAVEKLMWSNPLRLIGKNGR